MPRHEIVTKHNIGDKVVVVFKDHYYGTVGTIHVMIEKDFEPYISYEIEIENSPSVKVGEAYVYKEGEI